VFKVNTCTNVAQRAMDEFSAAALQYHIGGLPR